VGERMSPYLVKLSPDRGYIYVSKLQSASF
jgi:hypothetical protein